jgi:hypothetical protein
LPAGHARVAPWPDLALLARHSATLCYIKVFDFVRFERVNRRWSGDRSAARQDGQSERLPMGYMFSFVQPSASIYFDFHSDLLQSEELFLFFLLIKIWRLLAPFGALVAYKIVQVLRPKLLAAWSG